MLHVAKMHRGVGCMLKTAIKQCSCSFTCLSTKISLFIGIDCGYEHALANCYEPTTDIMLADFPLHFSWASSSALPFSPLSLPSSAENMRYCSKEIIC